MVRIRVREIWVIKVVRRVKVVKVRVVRVQNLSLSLNCKLALS